MSNLALLTRSPRERIGATAMNLFEIEIGRSYKCDREDGQHLATVKHKQDGQIGVALHNEVGSASDPVQVTDSRGLIWLKPDDIHPL
jgi:hypothetical protein